MIIGQGVIVKDMGTRHMRVVGATIGWERRHGLAQCPDAIIGSGRTIAPRNIQKPFGQVS